jgi:hypothetical protein
VFSYFECLEWGRGGSTFFSTAAEHVQVVTRCDKTEFLPAKEFLTTNPSANIPDGEDT